ncbi:alpha/beta hydrolase fold [Popillia japonica]|uniref:sn-1-specific diacylglycerol lipase ABHD11 n=1 Tax=Popillia japonica TaxID=7064 RepID=A0AAW1N330_POPJA
MSSFYHKFKVLLHSFNESHRLSNIVRHLCIAAKGPNNENLIPVELSYASYENQTTQTHKYPPILILHGYLASKRNWGGTAKRLFNEINSQRKVLTIDMRNHGDTIHSNEHTNSHLVEDLRHFIQQFQLNTVALLGHSYGGLISMLFALFYPDIVEKLIIVDIIPIDQTENFHQTENFRHVRAVLDTISKITVPPKIPLSLARKLMDQEMQKRKVNKDERLFLLTQLIQKENGNISWRFNLEVLRKHVLETASFPEIKGSKTSPILNNTFQQLNFATSKVQVTTKQYFPTAEFRYVQGAGHSVHADKPTQFLEICSEFLNRES